jgi:hypothetical protein
MRNQQRTSTRVEKRACKPGEGLGTLCTPAEVLQAETTVAPIAF